MDESTEGGKFIIAQVLTLLWGLSVATALAVLQPYPSDWKMGNIELNYSLGMMAVVVSGVIASLMAPRNIN